MNTLYNLQVFSAASLSMRNLRKLRNDATVCFACTYHARVLCEAYVAMTKEPGQDVCSHAGRSQHACKACASSKLCANAAALRPVASEKMPFLTRSLVTTLALGIRVYSEVPHGFLTVDQLRNKDWFLLATPEAQHSHSSLPIIWFLSHHWRKRKKRLFSSSNYA